MRWQSICDGGRGGSPDPSRTSLPKPLGRIFSCSVNFFFFTHSSNFLALVPPRSPHPGRCRFSLGWSISLGWSCSLQLPWLLPASELGPGLEPISPPFYLFVPEMNRLCPLAPRGLVPSCALQGPWVNPRCCPWVIGLY